MENGSFQAPFSDLSGLEFREELPPIPQMVPTRAATEMPRTKSGTVEALIAQNEDLMARLKVTLRRLNALEDENAEIRNQEESTRAYCASLSDQLLVWDEKQKFWHQKNQTLEAKMQSLHARFPELEHMEDRLERYKKYHEKIRTQVKPYIQQLKAYAQNLVLEIRKLNTEIEEKEIRRQDLERRIRELRNEVDQELRRQDEQNRTLIQIFEQEKDRLRMELLEAQRLNEHLIAKTQRLDEALMQRDELENLVIALRRTKEKSEIGYDQTLRDREQQLHDLRKELIEKQCHSEEMDRKAKAAHEESERQRHRADLLQEQLSSLRYLWTGKCEESEKLQERLQSLEKLNQELSSRLNQARKGEASL